nr:reverse transcriptase domain-containing protein [Tanacetum cinerariifolium]
MLQINNGTNNQGNRNDGGGENNYNKENDEGEHEHARGRTAAVGMAWDDFKTLLRDEYCPHNKMQRLEISFRTILWMVRETKPSTIHSVILKAGGLTDDTKRNGLLKRSTEKMKENAKTCKKEDARSNNKKARTGK